MKHLVHLHNSSTIPKPDNLSTGEIAVGNDKLYIKNTEAVKENELTYKDLSYFDIYGGKHTTRETANCYVIREPGYYCFPLVYGNAITGDKVNTGAYTIGTGSQYKSEFINYIGNQISNPYILPDTSATATSAEILIADEDNIISNVNINYSFSREGNIIFHVDRIPDSGANAIIGLIDNNNEVIWSWHIWLWKESLTPITLENYNGSRYKILPVNLGSKYDSTGHLINWFYQWGRKDPMLLPESYNSSNNHTYYGSLSFSIESCTDNVKNTIKNPCTFYKTGGNYNNWTQRPDFFYNYWDATCDSTGFIEKTVVKTIYDPCPRGFCVPNARVFTGFTATGNNTDDSSLFSVASSWNNGWDFRTISGGSSIFFSASGYRDGNNGGISEAGSYGYCWTSGNYSENYSSSLNFSSREINPLYNFSRSHACSIRPCMMYDETDLDISGLGVFSKVDSSKEMTENKVTSVNSLSTHTQYPSAKCVYNWMLNIFDNQGGDIINNYTTVGFYVDLSRCDINLKPQATRETANCYIIARPGFYCFPLVMGCGLKETMIPGDVDLNAKSYAPFGFTSPYLTGVYDSTILLTDADSVTIGNFTLLEGGEYLGFYVSSIPEEGANYIIGVVDNQKNILWSWHIWLWGESLSLDRITNYSGNTYDIFPVNLGSKYVSGELKSWFYQWGRKDPMPYSNLSGFSVVTGVGRQDPREFYTDWTAPYNAWNTNATSATSDESNIVKSIYDPCPRGFVVPNAKVFTGFTTTGEDATSQKQFNVTRNWNSGWSFKQFPNDIDGSLFLALGYRLDQLTNDGLEGYYWTSGMSLLGKGCGLSFGETFISYPKMNLSYGCSIRPCKES